ncbi:MAG: ATP-dependent Clp protease ATP-binding subunit, partial [Clostridia bacterium]|nr:ATP-dependent Clp protease ATP-binding subunit [Clostridia bacterium]
VTEEESAVVNQEKAKGKTDTPNALSQYTRNLTQEAREMRLEPMIGRSEEINAVIQILGKKTKNNPLLIGEPGVGKTAVVEGLAQRIVAGEVPLSMKNLKVYALDMTRLLAGTRFRGDFEERLTRLIDTVQADSDTILFIDEIHTLVGGGRMEGAMDIGNMLKPALARGTMRVIGATTHKEYRKYFEKDMALARRFQRVDIDEPSRSDTLNILMGLRERFEEFHHVTISDEALTAAVDYSSRYVTDRFLPDKAIDLLDETASMRKLGIGELGESVNRSRRLLEAIRQGDDALRNELICQRVRDRENPVVIQSDVAKVISTWTGIPTEQILFRGNENLLTLEERLNKRVIGQEEAVRAVCSAMRRSVSGLGDPDRPLGVFLLLGTSGVGKTELCRALAESYYGSEDALIRLDMSEYAEEIALTSLIGSPPGYVGYGDGAKLTDSVLNRPYSVVLFDEIEKAHPKVYNLFLQLLDNGELTDASGRHVNFRNTIVMMTSNAGVSFDLERQMGFGDTNVSDVKRQLLNRVKNVFRPEFLGRIDDVIVMNRLTEADGARIADNMLNKLSVRLGARGIRLEWTPDVTMQIARQGMDKSSGARNIRKMIMELVEDPLSVCLLQEPDRKIVRLAAPNGQIEITLNQMPETVNLPVSPADTGIQEKVTV